MALRMHLARGGSKKHPFYRIVVADSRCPRDGRFIEKIGTYNPLLSNDDPKRVCINEERARYWLSVGAKPSERIELFFANAGLCKKKEITATPKKSAPKKKAQEKMRLAAEAAANA